MDGTLSMLGGPGFHNLEARFFLRAQVDRDHAPAGWRVKEPDHGEFHEAENNCSYLQERLNSSHNRVANDLPKIS